jgi:hypothetical protein
MTLPRRRLSLAGTTLVLVLAAMTAALAFWSTSGSGAASGTLGTLTAAELDAPAGSGGTTTLTWTAQAALPGNDALRDGITYRVERRPDGGTYAAVASGPCAGDLPYGTTSCADTVTADGTYGYRVVARWRTWTATSQARTVAVARATQLAVDGPAGATAGSPFTVTVTAKSAAGTTVADVARDVTLSTVSGGAVACAASTVAASGGVATFRDCHVDVAGTGVRLRAQDGTLTGTSAAFDVAPAAAAALAFTQEPSASTPALSPFARQPMVTVRDAYGNTAATEATVRLALTSPGGATLSCAANPRTSVSGVASFAGCSVDRAGTYTLTATATGLASAPSAAFTITAPLAARLAFTTQPSGATGGVVLGTQPVVTVQDAAGRTVDTDTSAVTLALTSPSGATLSCLANPKTASAGVASFAGCKVDRVGTYTLTATGSGLTSASSASFTITTGPPATVAVSSGSGQLAYAPSAFAAPLVAKVTDAGGNPVGGTSVTFTAPGSGASGTFGGTGTRTASAVSVASGLATAPAFTPTATVGSYAVAATATGATSGSFTLTNGVFTLDTFTYANGNSGKWTVTGAGAAPGASITVTLCRVTTIPCPAGSVATTTTVTAPAGGGTWTVPSGAGPTVPAGSYTAQAVQASPAATSNTKSSGY